MFSMNGLVVYYSKFGNTRQIAEAVAQAWQPVGSIRLMSADQLAASDLSDVDLLVVGTPTHVANLPKELRPILEALPKCVLKGVSFAAFDTSYRSNWFVNMFTASKRLNKKLRRLGGKQMVRPETFFVEGKEGPLYEGEIERAKTWAETVAAKHKRLSER
jgi:flavodoxin